MPLEIRELIIKARIEEEGDNQMKDVDHLLQDIIEECVEQVLEILKEKSER